MTNKITSKQISRNIAISLSAQIIAFLSGIVINILVPKYISELQYSYWQTYILYSGYVGLFHFGLLDGMVLRYSKYNYDELDKDKLCSQFKILLAIISVSAVVVFTILNLIIVGNKVNIITVFVCMGIITKNIYTYTTYLLQITNRISKYAITVIIQRGFYLISAIILLIIGVKQFYFFCFADLSADAIGFMIGAQYNKGLFLNKKVKFQQALYEAYSNISSGIKLMIANLSANFLIGGAKLIVQWNNGTIIFGKVSFSFSISNIFLTFISAISIVMFPSLKRSDKEQLDKLYINIRKSMTWGMFSVIILYYPVICILQLWLPSYIESLYYLGILLPAVIYLSRISLLTNNYLKVLRKESSMLTINVLSVIFGMILFSVASFVWDNLLIMLFFIVLIVIARSVVSEIVVVRLLNVNVFKDIILELLITILFIFFAMGRNYIQGVLGYLIVLVIYTCYNREGIKLIGKILKNYKLACIKIYTKLFY